MEFLLGPIRFSLVVAILGASILASSAILLGGRAAKERFGRVIYYHLMRRGRLR